MSSSSGPWGYSGGPREPREGQRIVTWVPAAAAIVLLAVFPMITSGYFTSTVGMRSMWMGIAAASLIFLAAYGGMVSLAQTALYGIAGFSLRTSSPPKEVLSTTTCSGYS